MSLKRKHVLANNEIYHVYNRGIDRRVTFTNKREYERALELLWFYQYAANPVRYSRFVEAPESLRLGYLGQMKEHGRLVEVISFCLMPNHFHIQLRQKQENGIAIYISNFINAYTKYFNTKYQRTGALFQGVFKSVHIDTEEQLVHLTRYIHLNPVASSLITREQLSDFPWSSHQHYLKKTTSDIIQYESISMIHSLVHNYESFVNDHISYARELEKIKHLTFEHE